MATDKKRWTISVDDDMFDAIEKYRYENKLATRSGATIELVKLGLQDLMKELEQKEDKKNKAPTAEEAEEAMITALKYMLGREPSGKEKDLFSQIAPMLLNGIKNEQ